MNFSVRIVINVMDPREGVERNLGIPPFNLEAKDIDEVRQRVLASMQELSGAAVASQPPPGPRRRSIPPEPPSLAAAAAAGARQDPPHAFVGQGNEQHALELRARDGDVSQLVAENEGLRQRLRELEAQQAPPQQGEQQPASEPENEQTQPHQTDDWRSDNG